ncbi:LPS export ABC transporter periplasmic protein LptC [Afifella sp. IM 167]|uniref:LPS export ABC transporter periplasmic protein LptC n=1 Tax=Afifella sp. IM 167 TaxID=2033586 RepID=UPI001CCADD3A|nr:LPS export ABC transporter periplasmic protein LptC [Afifella sp. IM 167]MBZ8133754.1 LPS export ABC transporter periplasmic protein LptC [Afifella sp. IM 167]
MMLVATPADMGPPEQFAFDRVRTRTAAYRAARRHSLFVRVLRFALPVTGFAALAGMVYLGQLSPGEQFDLSIAKTTIAKNAIIMDNPKLTGFDRFEREFRLEADRAIQKFATPDAVTLENIVAYITAPGRGPVEIEARNADFDNAAGALVLDGDVNVDSTDGYGMLLHDAKIDTKNSTLSSPNPVVVTYRDSRTTGDTIGATEGGRHIVIEGNVRTHLMPPNRDKAGNEKPAGGAEDQRAAASH